MSRDRRPRRTRQRFEGTIAGLGLHRRHPHRARPLAGVPVRGVRRRHGRTRRRPPAAAGARVGRWPTSCRRRTPSTRCASSPCRSGSPRRYGACPPGSLLVSAFTTAGRPPLGWLLRAVPATVAASPAWASAVDPVRPGAAAGGADPRQRRWGPVLVVRRAGPAPDRLDARQLGRHRPRRPGPGRPPGAVRVQLDTHPSVTHPRRFDRGAAGQPSRSPSENGRLRAVLADHRLAGGGPGPHPTVEVRHAPRTARRRR